MCTWNSNKPYFERVLQSIKREIPVHCFILVDRFSCDNGPQVVQRYFPDARIILTNSELAKARQLGIQFVDTEHFVFVDDDIVLPNGWFRGLWGYIDSETGAIHAQAVPVVPLLYEEKWRRWQEKRAERLGKMVERGILEVTEKNMDKNLGYTHNTIVRTDSCKDWRPPADLSVFEDQVLLWHIVKKGYKWRIVQEISVQHYSSRCLAEHLRKVRWRVAGGRMIGVLNYSLKNLLVADSVKRVAKSFKASLDLRDPRIMAYVFLLNVAYFDGYMRWSKWVRLIRH